MLHFVSLTRRAYTTIRKVLVGQSHNRVCLLWAPNCKLCICVTCALARVLVVEKKKTHMTEVMLL
jgi:hypothetical protein